MAVWFSFSPAGALLLVSAAFIMLSAGCMTEARQCYWCGPLAEQVHRSRRALPCAPTAAHLTVCEQNLNYCAVIATSPPYIESRVCVKVYQDECYPLFCNSTKTWRMTCPCRGDLCNGPNTEREVEAFAALGKLVAKTHSKKRSKRANPVGFLSQRNEKIINPEDVAATTIEAATLHTEFTTEIADKATPNAKDTQATVDNENQVKETSKLDDNTIVTTQIMDKEKDTEQTTSKPDESPITTETIPRENVDNNVTVIKGEVLSTANKKELEVATAPNMIELDIKNTYPSPADRLDIYRHNVELQADDPNVQADEPKAHDSKEDSDNNKMNGTTVNAGTEPTKAPTSETTGNTSPAPEPSATKTPNTNNDKLKPSEEPTAEAFQQNNTPVNKKVGKPLNAPPAIMSTTEKAPEHTTIAQTTMHTILENAAPKSTLAPKNNTKNYAEATSSDVLSIIICILINYAI